MGNKIKKKEKIEYESYYDGVPQYIKDMTPEELDKAIEEEEKRLAEINKNK